MFLVLLGLLTLCAVVFFATYVGAGFMFDREMEKHAQRSEVPLDIVFVVAEKDAATLPYSVRSVRKWVKHPIRKIVLIGRSGPTLKGVAEELGLGFIDEDTLLSLGDFREWLDNEHLALNHSSLTWYYQQFLKLLYHRISDSEYYFVVDADIVIKRPMVLVSGDDVHTFFIGENLGHEISKASIHKLLGESAFVPEFSFIADLMCFKKETVASLIGDIESRFGTDFYKAAILVEQGNEARFSEYELYGVYASGASRDLLVSYAFRPDFARSRGKLWLDQYKLKLKAVPYVAYHHYLN